jgi:general stress protein YciG
MSPRKKQAAKAAPAETGRVRQRPGPKPGSDAAKRGGAAARAKYGSDFYRAIGAVGGKKVRSTKGPDFYRDIGRRGGQTTRTRLGLEHYARIGRMGGLHRKKRQPGSAASEQPA